MLNLIGKDLYYVGDCSHTEKSFERMFNIPTGMAYNSFLYVDDKTCLIDTVDNSIIDKFLDHVKEVLNGRKLDILIVQHMEPDHSKAIKNILDLYPDVHIYASSSASRMLNLYLKKDIKNQFTPIIPNKTTLDLGHHQLSFINATFIHWPEVIFTYDTTEKILFSADAFGTFGANDGILFADNIKKDDFFYSEMRRYYTNIVGKYGSYVQKVLKGAQSLEIKLICPLHGPIWRNDFATIISLYDKWSSYTPEANNEVAIFVGSMYSNTLEAAVNLQKILISKGIKTTLFDVSDYEVSYLVSEAFRVKNIVLASPTYNNGIFPYMETFITHLINSGLAKRNYALMESGSWAPMANRVMEGLLSKVKDSVILDTKVSFMCAYNPATVDSKLEALANNIIEKM